MLALLVVVVVLLLLLARHLRRQHRKQHQRERKGRWWYVSLPLTAFPFRFWDVFGMRDVINRVHVNNTIQNCRGTSHEQPREREKKRDRESNREMSRGTDWLLPSFEYCTCSRARAKASVALPLSNCTILYDVTVIVCSRAKASVALPPELEKLASSSASGACAHTHTAQRHDGGVRGARACAACGMGSFWVC